MDLPVKLHFYTGTFLNSVLFGHVYSVFVLFRRDTANKEPRTFSHKATFKTNWVCMCNEFATVHGDCEMIEAEVPLVATDFNCGACVLSSECLETLMK